MKWISVKDGLPCNEKTVFVRTEITINLHRYGGAFFKSDTEQWWYDKFGDARMMYLPVTHWCEIEEPEDLHDKLFNQPMCKDCQEIVAALCENCFTKRCKIGEKFKDDMILDLKEMIDFKDSEIKRIIDKIKSAIREKY